MSNLLERFNQALVPLHAHPVTALPLDGWIKTQPGMDLDALLVRAAAGELDAIDTVRSAGQCMGLMQCLADLGHECVDADTAEALIRAHGPDPLRDCILRARNGDAAAAEQLARWIAAARREGGRRRSLQAPLLFPTGQVTRRDEASTGTATVVQGNEPRRYDQVKVHGAKAALTLIADETRAGEPTITIECAAGSAPPERAYVWDDKLRFQLTAVELQLLTCLLLGDIGTLAFRNHGDKWLSATRQDAPTQYAGTIRVTLGRGGAAPRAPRTVVIDHTALGSVAALCLRQCACLLRLPVETIPAVLHSVADAYIAQSKMTTDGDRRVSREDGKRVRPVRIAQVPNQRLRQNPS